MTSQTVRSPEFPGVATWLNTRRPLTVGSDLRGQVTVLDFWTYCCINCMHVLPALRRLEARFAGQPVAVIGVHAAKFLSEKDPQNIRRAIARHGITHPIIVDSEHDIWEQFGVRAWPTLVVVDPQGYVRATLPGEPDEGELAALVQELLDEGRARGVLAGGPLDVAPDPDTDRTLLRFPGKVHLHGDRLYIADTGHHRIVVSDLEGHVQMIVGEGGAGAQDGLPTRASFCSPQGVAMMGGVLYVADTGNHLLRGVDPGTGEVTTLAGTGELGRGQGSANPREPRKVPLRSPWGLLSMGEQLLVAMAGTHQIWVYDPSLPAIAPWAGSGVEDHIDGPLKEAAFAQPSGLTRAGQYILVADSEVSSVRAIDLQDGIVRTVVGKGLFDFGDEVGAPDNVLLQHPLDVAAADRTLYVADSYNNKIKAIAFGTMQTSLVFGNGSPEVLGEPGGIAAGGGMLFIADTNNHRIRRGDLASGELSDLRLQVGAKGPRLAS
jgi:thiol-disulfide isomerase/thioredoxin